MVWEEIYLTKKKKTKLALSTIRLCVCVSIKAY